MLLWARKFATVKIECSFEIGKYKYLWGHHLFCWRWYFKLHIRASENNPVFMYDLSETKTWSDRDFGSSLLQSRVFTSDLECLCVS